MMKSLITSMSLVLVALSSGCAFEPAELEADDTNAEQDPVVGRGPVEAGHPNGLKWEALEHADILKNDGVRRDLLGRRLHTDHLSSRVRQTIRDDPRSKELMEYIVMCALGRGTKVSVPEARREYDGFYGLAEDTAEPDRSEDTWHTDECGPICQRWVSACIMAHTNHVDGTKYLILSGVHNQIDRDRQVDNYRKREGAFWGNIFADHRDQKRHACWDDWRGAFGPRVCGTNSDDKLCHRIFNVLNGGEVPRCDASLCSTSSRLGESSEGYWGYCQGEEPGGGSLFRHREVVTVWRAW